MTIDRTTLEESEVYSEELDIDLATTADDELFKWFLASQLFGARISETIAKNTYRAFERHDLLTPARILAIEFEFLVDPVMREGGYVRYDYQRSDQIRRNAEALETRYGGSLTQLHEEAVDRVDLEARLDAFHRVGAVTVNIFLRELRPFWERAIRIRSRSSPNWPIGMASTSAVATARASPSRGSKPASSAPVESDRGPLSTPRWARDRTTVTRLRGHGRGPPVALASGRGAGPAPGTEAS